MSKVNPRIKPAPKFDTERLAGGSVGCCIEIKST